MKAGDVFYLPDHGGGHPNCILEVFPDGSAVVCNITDYNSHPDKTCILEVGEHSVVTKRSVVNFQKAYHCESGLPIEALARQIYHPKEPLRPEILLRIRQAALTSPHTSDVIKKALGQKNEEKTAHRKEQV